MFGTVHTYAHYRHLVQDDNFPRPSYHTLYLTHRNVARNRVEGYIYLLLGAQADASEEIQIGV
jgi:hypothetical protein